MDISVATQLSSRNFLRQLDLGTLDLFILTCECGSIAGAAAQGQLAASALSKRIAELEQLAGAPLLQRHARGVRPTFLGEQVQAHAQAILAEAENLRRDLSELAGGIRGRVRLCASASAVEQFLPSDLAGFAREHPDIRIDLRQNSSSQVASMVLARQADLGICSLDGEVAALQSRPYRSEQLVLAVPRGHPLARPGAIAYARALDYEQIGVRGSSAVQELLARAAVQAGKPLRQRMEVDSLSVMCSMIECGMGIGVMPQGVFRNLAARRLQAVKLSDPWATRQLCLYALDFDALEGPARLFAQQFGQRRRRAQGKASSTSKVTSAGKP